MRHGDEEGKDWVPGSMGIAFDDPESISEVGEFLERLGKAVTLESYLVGVGKAPVFAAIVAAVGCFQGLQVSGSAESVGQRTTVSVVHSIIAVIVVDAAFSVLFSWLGI